MDPDFIVVFLRPLNTLGIPYAVTGGVASIVYGEPRFTRDIDLVMTLDRVGIDRLTRHLPAAEYYVPPKEVLVEEAGRLSHGHFNLQHHETGLRADIYLTGDDQLNQWAVAHAKPVVVGDTTIPIAPIESVIAYKLWYVKQGASDRHYRDIASMRRISEEQIDHQQLHRWIVALGVERQWEQAQALES